MPNGVAFLGEDLFVAEVSNIWKFENIDDNVDSNIDPVLINDSFPTESSHGWKYIAFGPDEKLYVPVGAPCNVCNHENENPIYASLTRMNPDGTDREIIAHGIRNTVGFTWHPETGNLWFTDNGRDWMGDDIPPCELNELVVEGAHFGFPYLHGNDVWDPEFGSSEEIKQRDFVKPIQELGPHVAPLGLMFYTGDMFPLSYKNQAFIAEHGSWNRSEKIGYQISLVTFDDSGNATSYQPFIKGWLQEGDEILGRPVAFLQMPDGSVLISDDHTGTIYRVTYTG
jgi:glucose/arabinose dehydrogenase